MTLENHPHLSTAPITEAVIHLRTRKTDVIPNDIRDSINSSLGDQFAEILEINQHQINIQIGPDADPSKRTLNHIGFRAMSDDKSQVLQLMEDQFVFSQLAPYDCWEKFIADAKAHWRIYCEHFKCPDVIRVATRFINEIKLPLPLSSFEDFLTASPSIPHALPQAMSSFLSRVVIDVPELPANVILTQSLEAASADASSLSVIVDIDVFQRKQYASESDEIWNTLTEMRKIKNDTFFSSLTERALEEYK